MSTYNLSIYYPLSLVRAGKVEELNFIYHFILLPGIFKTKHMTTLTKSVISSVFTQVYFLADINVINFKNNS